VDACITNAEGLRDGGTGSRSEILYTNISRLSRKLSHIAKHYQTPEFVKTANELKDVGR